jgi:endonuclease YncB( thermonuclease family)
MMVAGASRVMRGLDDRRQVPAGVCLPPLGHHARRRNSGDFSGHIAGSLAGSLTGGTRFRAVLLLSLVAIRPVGAVAMDMPAVCKGEIAQAAHLVSIVDATTFKLDDGRTVRLAGVGVEDQDTDTTAYDGSAMADLRPGQALSLFAVSARPDRWGRFSARIGVVQSGAGEPVSWLAGALVARGQVQVMPGDGASACHDALYGLEIEARAARHGVWADPANRVWQANDPALGQDGVGAWRIVSGRVLSVGVTQYNHYLNFGRDWNTDFTVTVRTKDVERFAAAGRHPAGLEGRVVRVRGWLRAWNGAVIDVRWPGEIEVVDGRD